MSAHNDPPLNSVASKVRLGDRLATEQFAKYVSQVGHQWLSKRGVARFQDREDIIQDVVVRFLNDWNSGRSSAYTFLTYILLPTALARFFRAASGGNVKIESTPRSNGDDLELISNDEQQTADRIAPLLRKRSSFLNSSEKEAIRCHLSHPGWTAQQVASACGVNASAASIATRYKLPLELMNQWAFSKGVHGDGDDLINFSNRLHAWHADGNSSLAAMGLDILLTGLATKRQSEAFGLVDGNGDPGILPLLFLRIQVALAQQELVLADRLLVWMDKLLRHPSLTRAHTWCHRLHYVRGRWHTAAFGYADALTAYGCAFEVPKPIWRRDALFLHSVAIAYRGVKKFSLAEDFVNQSLEVYAMQGRIADVAHTISRKARINMERGESEQNFKALVAAEEGLEQVHTQYPDFSARSPMGYLQYRLHHLRFSALTERRPNDIRAAIQGILTLINRDAYAHEFLELQEVCQRYDLFSKFHGLTINYKPARPRFGQKRIQRLRTETLRRIP